MDVGKSGVIRLRFEVDQGLLMLGISFPLQCSEKLGGRHYGGDDGLRVAKSDRLYEHICSAMAPPCIAVRKGRGSVPLPVHNPGAHYCSAKISFPFCMHFPSSTRG